MKWFKAIHLIYGTFVSLLVVSGICLYIGKTRAFFNELGFPLVYFHLAIAVVFVAVVCYSFVRVARFLWRKPRIKRFNFAIHILCFFLWTISGTVMYFQASVPVSLRNFAVFVHDWTTFLFLPWLFVHTIGHLLNWRIPWPKWWTSHVALPEVIEENKLERRDFLKLFGLTFLFFLFGSLFKWFTPLLTAVEKDNKRRGYFRIYNVTNDYPRYENDEWTLTIDGLTNKTEKITLHDLRRFKTTTIVTDFHCVTGWSVRNVEMTGVKVKDLLDELAIEPHGEFVTAYSGDGIYYDSFKTSQLLDEGALIVYEIDGEPLKHPQGYPCRLYHPDMYGYKSVKWLERLHFTDKREIGYWQRKGNYDLDGYL